MALAPDETTTSRRQNERDYTGSITFSFRCRPARKTGRGRSTSGCSASAKCRSRTSLAGRGGAWFESGAAKLHLGVEPDMAEERPPYEEGAPGLVWFAGWPSLSRGCRRAAYTVTFDAAPPRLRPRAHPGPVWQPHRAAGDSLSPGSRRTLPPAECRAAHYPRAAYRSTTLIFKPPFGRRVSSACSSNIRLLHRLERETLHHHRQHQLALEHREVAAHADVGTPAEREEGIRADTASSTPRRTAPGRTSAGQDRYGRRGGWSTSGSA